MSYPTVFHLLTDVFKKANVPFLLVGGFAVNHYKVTRLTYDIDVLTAEKNYQKVKPGLEQAGYKEMAIGNLFARLQANKPTLMDLDILFVDLPTFTQMFKEAQEIEVKGNKIFLPTLEHLIAMKLHSLRNNPEGREIPDLVDIANLVKENKIDVKSPSFKDLCLKFGTETVYNKLLERQKSGET